MGEFRPCPSISLFHARVFHQGMLSTLSLTRCGSLDLDFAAFRSVRNKYLFFINGSIPGIVIAAQNGLRWYINELNKNSEEFICTHFPLLSFNNSPLLILSNGLKDHPVRFPLELVL